MPSGGEDAEHEAMVVLQEEEPSEPANESTGGTADEESKLEQEH